MDLARVIAIGAVVLIHVVAPTVSGGAGEALTHPRWWLGNVVDSACRFSVPLFIMISGAPLLARRNEGLGEFYLRRLRRIGLPLAFWSVFYLLFRAHVLDQPVTISTALRSTAFAVPYFHLYFLFILLGLYLATPFLRMLVAALPERGVLGLAAGLIALGAADQVLSAFFGAGRANAVTMFLPYLGYYLAGHALQRVQLPRRAVGLAALTFGGSVLLTAVGTWVLARQYGWTAQGSYLYGYLSPTVIAGALAAFLLLRALPTLLPAVGRPGVERWVGRLSPLTFGVYLVHPALMALEPHLGVDLYPTRAPALLVAVAVHWTALTLASLVVVALGRRVPGLRAVL